MEGMENINFKQLGISDDLIYLKGRYYKLYTGVVELD